MRGQGRLEPADVDAFLREQGTRALAAVDQLRESDDPAAALCEILDGAAAAAFGLDARVEPHTHAAIALGGWRTAREVAGSLAGLPEPATPSELVAALEASSVRLGDDRPSGRVRVVGLRRARTHRVSTVIMLGLETGAFRAVRARMPCSETACAGRWPDAGCRSCRPDLAAADRYLLYAALTSARGSGDARPPGRGRQRPAARGIALLDGGARGPRRRLPTRRALRPSRSHPPARRRALRPRASPRPRLACGGGRARGAPHRSDRPRLVAPHRPGAGRVRTGNAHRRSRSARRARGAAHVRGVRARGVHRLLAALVRRPGPAAARGRPQRRCQARRKRDAQRPQALLRAPARRARDGRGRARAAGDRTGSARRVPSTMRSTRCRCHRDRSRSRSCATRCAASLRPSCGARPRCPTVSSRAIWSRASTRSSSAASR